MLLMLLACTTAPDPDPVVPAPEPDCRYRVADMAPRLGPAADVERTDTLVIEHLTYPDGTWLKLTQLGCDTRQVGYVWEVAGVGHDRVALLHRVVTLTGDAAVELQPYALQVETLDSEYFSCAEDTECGIAFEEDAQKETTQVMVLTTQGG